MLRAMDFYEQGLITPVTPTTTFSALQISEPFRYMQKAQHIGKIVVSMPDKVEDLPQETVREELALNPDRAYLFVGGLGGLGRSIATWLTEKGARHIVFLSRSAGSIPQDDPFVMELSTLGCMATMVSGDVCNYDDVVRAIKAAGKPVAGVLQASMVLKVSTVEACPLPFFRFSEATAANSPCRITRWSKCLGNIGERLCSPRSKALGICTTLYCRNNPNPLISSSCSVLQAP